jgi:hypothetical protein
MYDPSTNTTITIHYKFKATACTLSVAAVFHDMHMTNGRIQHKMLLEAAASVSLCARIRWQMPQDISSARQRNVTYQQLCDANSQVLDNKLQIFL